MSFEDEIPLYHPQEITYQIGCQPEQPFPVHHLTGNLYDETKSRVESLTELQTKLLNWYSEIYEGWNRWRLKNDNKNWLLLVEISLILSRKCTSEDITSTSLFSGLMRTLWGTVFEIQQTACCGGQKGIPTFRENLIL